MTRKKQRQKRVKKLTEPPPPPPTGPVTDYGATIVHWMRNRRPGYQGSYRGEVERPSASYIVDVSTSTLVSGAIINANSSTDASTHCQKIESS